MNIAVKILEPSGILDATTAQKFRQEIERSIDENIRAILIDFTHVTFMDSSGLGTLVLSLKTVRAAGAKLYLCSLNDQIKMLFELTSMDRVFEIFSSREEFEENFLKN